MVCARTGEGRARAKARGVKLGRKPKLTPHQKREALERRARGDETLAEIGPQLQCERLDDLKAHGAMEENHGGQGRSLGRASP